MSASIRAHVIHSQWSYQLELPRIATAVAPAATLAALAAFEAPLESNSDSTSYNYSSNIPHQIHNSHSCPSSTSQLVLTSLPLPHSLGGFDRPELHFSTFNNAQPSVHGLSFASPTATASVHLHVCGSGSSTFCQPPLGRSANHHWAEAHNILLHIHRLHYIHATSWLRIPCGPSSPWG